MKISITLLSKKAAKGLGVLIFWVALWYVAALVTGQELLVPTPLKTVDVLFEFVSKGSFWSAVLLSTLRIISGFLLGVLIGVLGGISSVKSKLFDALTSPILRIARAVPVVSFILLAYVWIKTNFIPVFITALMVAPIIWATVAVSIKGIDKSLVEMGKVFRLSKKDIFFKIKFPQVAPAFVSACLTTLGLAWKSGVAAEVLCYPERSLGRLLHNASTYLETAETFALTLVVVVISLALESLVKFFAKRWAEV